MFVGSLETPFFRAAFGSSVVQHGLWASRCASQYFQVSLHLELPRALGQKEERAKKKGVLGLTNPLPSRAHIPQRL